MPDDPQSSAMARENNGTIYDTIILGAGISGLACANRLHQRLPNSRIKVLEARDRIGGRINSVWKEGSRLDTGANWIHGTGTEDNPNPLTQILPNKRMKEIGGGVFFKPPREGNDEDLMVPREVAGKLMVGMWGMIGELHELAQSTSQKQAESRKLLDAIQNSKMFSSAFDEVDSDYHSTLRGIPQFVENMEAAPLVPSSAESNYTKPTVSVAEYSINDFEGDQVFLQDGYTPLIQELAKPLLSSNLIDTSTAVERIDYTTAPITVETNNGIYHARNIVVTLPLGVLKATYETLFQPALPKAKQAAIENLGFGTLDKIFLLYSSPWWTSEPWASYFKAGTRLETDPGSEEEVKEEPDTFMGFTHALSGLSISPSSPGTDGPRILSYINLHALSGFPVLGVFVSCSNALAVEAMTDAQAGELAHEALVSWLPESLGEVPAPVGVHVTRWAGDEWARGSYSHMITGVSGKGCREEFQKAMKVEGPPGGVPSEVRFAGEHTSSEHFATAHGGLLSGWREADAIIEAAKTSS